MIDLNSIVADLTQIGPGEDWPSCSMSWSCNTTSHSHHDTGTVSGKSKGGKAAGGEGNSSHNNCNITLPHTHTTTLAQSVANPRVARLQVVRAIYLITGIKSTAISQSHHDTGTVSGKSKGGKTAGGEGNSLHNWHQNNRNITYYWLYIIFLSHRK